MNQDERLDHSAADSSGSQHKPGSTSLPEDYSNPPGVGRGACDIEEHAEHDAECDFEATAQVQDFVLEETKPGMGIEGFEGEEVGGG